MLWRPPGTMLLECCVLHLKRYTDTYLDYLLRELMLTFLPVLSDMMLPPHPHSPFLPHLLFPHPLTPQLLHLSVIQILHRHLRHPLLSHHIHMMRLLLQLPQHRQLLQLYLLLLLQLLPVLDFILVQILDLPLQHPFPEFISERERDIETHDATFCCI